jgi:hypothetical protein
MVVIGKHSVQEGGGKKMVATIVFYVSDSDGNVQVLGEIEVGAEISQLRIARPSQDGAQAGESVLIDLEPPHPMPRTNDLKVAVYELREGTQTLELRGTFCVPSSVAVLEIDRLNVEGEKVGTQESINLP